MDHSTFWILSVRDNEFGTLHSFDITDNVVKHDHIPSGTYIFARTKSSMISSLVMLGKVLRNLKDEEVNFDYLFLSIPYTEFARMYLTDVFSRQSSSNILHASVHDCYMNRCGATREECTSD